MEIQINQLRLPKRIFFYLHNDVKFRKSQKVDRRSIRLKSKCEKKNF